MGAVDHSIMNIRRLKYFISVANNLNFTKAAEECYVAQTVISHNIAVLEEEIDFRLFERDNRVVKLTPAGKAFLKEAKFMVDKYEKSVRDCQAIALDNNSMFKIGFVTQYESLKVSETIQEFMSHYPSIQLLIAQYTYKMLIEALKNGELDVAFSLPPYNVELLSELEVKRVAAETYYIAMCKSHPLANQKQLTASMLINEKVIVMDPTWEAQANYEPIKKFCRDLGLNEEKIITCSGNIDAALIMVELNMGICVVTSSMKKMHSNTLVFVDLDESFPKCEIVAIYLKSNKKASVQLFLDFIKRKEQQI